MTGFDIKCDINLAMIYMLIGVAMCKFVILLGQQPFLTPDVSLHFSHQFYIYLLNILYVKMKHIDGIVKEKRNPISNALELRLSCTNPSI